MRIHTFLLRRSQLFVPMAVTALLFTHCSDGANTTGDGIRSNSADEMRRTDSIRMAEGRTRNSDGTWTEPRVTRADTWANADDSYLYPKERRTSATPAEERAATASDMRGLRAILIADLELVRERLNDGARTNAQKETDQALAAELAQGLERVDRALAAMDAATNTTWSDMRDVQMKEVEDVRTWMITYRNNSSVRG